jgi:hypothetical protein
MTCGQKPAPLAYDCFEAHGAVEAGKRRLAGDTARAAATDEVSLRREARALK